LLSKGNRKQTAKAGHFEAIAPRWDKGLLKMKNERELKEGLHPLLLSVFLV
jgi:hypothetical protein